MKNTILILVFFFFINTNIFAQSARSITLQEIKKIPQAEIVEVPDSEIVYPLTGIVNITNKLERVRYSEIELWTIDATDRIIYSNIIATQNSGKEILDATYCHYQKLQGQYILKQRNSLMESR